MKKKVALLILDGRGISNDIQKSAAGQAQTPFLDSLENNVPYTQLQASEEAVGLPQGQVGNSEVGHSTLGTGRVNYQNLVRINKSIEDGDFFQHVMLLEAKEYACKNTKQIHILGLLSDGGVHSHIDHIKALVTAMGDQVCYIHTILDGRDTDPLSGLGFVKDFQGFLEETSGILVDTIGRYYGMDRDTRRERTQKAYDLYVHGTGTYYNNIEEALQQSYDSSITDEFFEPTRFLEGTNGSIQAGDVVIFANFRSDRARQLTSCLTQQAYPEYGMKPIDDLKFLCMTEYDSNFKNLEILFPSISLENTLGQVVSAAGKTQLRIAETEKYPHVSFFFNAGIETPYPGEARIMIPSPKVATYDLQPDMSALAITDACIDHVKSQQPDFICLNYANPDMVGHTGVFEAVVQACETVDRCLNRIVPFLTDQGYSCLIIADHGNADYMINDDGSPNTAHSLALVPCYLVHGPSGTSLRSGGSLADIAPTILALMEIEQPQEMTGKRLIVDT